MISAFPRLGGRCLYDTTLYHAARKTSMGEMIKTGTGKTGRFHLRKGRVRRETPPSVRTHPRDRGVRQQLLCLAAGPHPDQDGLFPRRTVSPSAVSIPSHTLEGKLTKAFCVTHCPPSAMAVWGCGSCGSRVRQQHQQPAVCKPGGIAALRRNAENSPFSPNAIFADNAKTAASVRDVGLSAIALPQLVPGKPDEFVCGGCNPLSYTQVRRMNDRIGRQLEFDGASRPAAFAQLYWLICMTVQKILSLPSRQPDILRPLCAESGTSKAEITAPKPQRLR